MFDKFLNFYSKYPWVAIILIVHWIATTYIIMYGNNVEITTIMGITFLATIIYAYFGFKAPKS